MDYFYKFLLGLITARIIEIYDDYCMMKREQKREQEYSQVAHQEEQDCCCKNE